MNLNHAGLSELYREIEALGDPLTGISDRIDFERIRPMLSDPYENDTEKGGRPNYDPILMVKILLLQQWYSLSDPQVERDIRDRISFMKFLGYPEKLPDRNTIWYFRERLSKTGKDRIAFNDILDQITSKRIRIKKGTMQYNRGKHGKQTFFHTIPLIKGSFYKNRIRYRVEGKVFGKLHENIDYDGG